jgi:hypothetical protein
MLGSQAVCMDHMTSQARWIMYHDASMHICLIYYDGHMGSRPDMRGSQTVWIMYMDHMGSRPIWTMYHNMQQTDS